MRLFFNKFSNNFFTIKYIQKQFDEQTAANA